MTTTATNSQDSHLTTNGLSKVPEITILFWILKIAATTLGEVGADSVTKEESLNLGYLIGTLIFILPFLGLVFAQIKLKLFHPFMYWTTIVASTTLGTTLADFSTRVMFGTIETPDYVRGTSVLLALLAASLFAWHKVLGSVSVASISSPKSEIFYWITIMFSQTLGTALGDWTANTIGLGFGYGTLIFTGLLVLVAVAYFWTKLSRTMLFWAAFILTRPFGAVLGDLLGEPKDKGGLDLGRYTITAILVGFIIACILIFKQRAAKTNGH